MGKWVETQRYEYTKLKRAEASPPLKVEDIQEDTKPGAKPRPTNARLTEERLRRLESIGFEWKVRNKMKRYYDKQWQDMFDQLLDFKSKNGHTMVPKRYPDNPRLANWVHTQRVSSALPCAGEYIYDGCHFRLVTHASCFCILMGTDSIPKALVGREKG